MFGSPARFSCSVPWFSGMHSADSSWFSPEKIGPMILSIPYVRSLSWALFSVLTLPTKHQRQTDEAPIAGKAEEASPPPEYKEHVLYSQSENAQRIYETEPLLSDTRLNKKGKQDAYVDNAPTPTIKWIFFKHRFAFFLSS